MSNPTDKSTVDNRANQLNPTHPAYHQSRGSVEPAATSQATGQPAVVNNRANQLNPNNPAHQPGGASASKSSNKGR